MHQGTGRKWQFTILKDCPLCHGWNPPFIWAWGLQLHASPCLHNVVPAYIHGFLNFSRISNDRPPSNNMRAVHISTCPTNAPNKWRKLQKKHHMVDVTLCSWAMGWSHMNISPRPVHAGLVSSIESSQTDFIWGGGSYQLEPVSGSSGLWDISEIKISIQRSSSGLY